MDAVELARWTRFAAKGGIGKCTATQDCIAESQEDLMFLKNDEITVLMHLTGQPDRYLGFCEGVVGRFLGAHVRFHGKLKRPVMTKRASSTASTSAASPVPSSSPSPRVSLSSLAAREATDSPIPPLSQSQIDKQRRASSRAERGREHAKDILSLTQKSRSPSRERNEGEVSRSTDDVFFHPRSSSPSSPPPPRRRQSEDQDGQSSEKVNRRRTHIVGEFAGIYSPPPSRSASDDKNEGQPGQDDDAKSEKSFRRRTKIIGDLSAVFSAPFVESPPPSPRPPLTSANKDEDSEVLSDKAQKRRTGLVGEFSLSPLILSPSPFTTEFKFPSERSVQSPPPILPLSPPIKLNTDPRSSSPGKPLGTAITDSAQPQEDKVPILATAVQPEQPDSEDVENHDRPGQDNATKASITQEEGLHEIDGSFYDRASLNSNSTDESSFFQANSSSARGDDENGERDMTLTTVNESSSKMDITIEGVSEDGEDADGGLGLGLAMLQDLADADSDESDSEEEWVRRRVGFIRTPEPSPKLPPPGFGTHFPSATLAVGKSPLSEASSEQTLLTSPSVYHGSTAETPISISTDPAPETVNNRDSLVPSEANVNIIASEDEDLNDEGEWDGADDIYDNYRYSRYSMYSTKKLRYSMMSKSSSLNEADPDSPLPPLPSDAPLQQPLRQFSDDSSSLRSSSVEASPGKAQKHLPPPLKIVPSPATTATTLLSPLLSAVPSIPVSSLTSPLVDREYTPLSLDTSTSTLQSSTLSPTPTPNDQPSTSSGLGLGRPLTPLLSPLSPAPSVSSFSGRLGGAASALRQKLENERASSRDPTPVPTESEIGTKQVEQEESRKIVVDDDEDVTITRDLLKRTTEEEDERGEPLDYDMKKSRTSTDSTASEQSTVSTVPTISSDIVKEMQRMEADLAALERRQAELTSRPGSSSASAQQVEPTQQPIRSPESASFNIPSTQPLRINHDRAQRSPISPHFSPSALDSTAPPPPYTQSQPEPATDVKAPMNPASDSTITTPPMVNQPSPTPSSQMRPVQKSQDSQEIQKPLESQTKPLQISLKPEQGPSKEVSAFLPHPNAPRPNPAVTSGQRMSTVGMPPVHVENSQPSKTNSLQFTLQMAAASRVGPNGAIRNTTIYGKTLADLATSTGPVPIIWSLEPFTVPKGNRGSQVPKRSATTAISPLAADVATKPSIPAVPLARPSPLAQPPPPPSPNVKDAGDFASPRSSKVIPRANFFPRAGGARPRSRSFSGLTSEFTSVSQANAQGREEGGSSRQPARIASMQSLKGDTSTGGRNSSRQSSISPTNTRNPSVPSPLSLPQNNTVAGLTSPNGSSFPSSPLSKSPLSPIAGYTAPSQSSDDIILKSSTSQKMGIRQVASTAALKASPSAFLPSTSQNGKRRNSGPAVGPSITSIPVSGFGLLRRLSSSTKHKRTLSQHSRSSVNSDTHPTMMTSPSVGPTASPSTSPVQRSNSLKSKLSLSALRVRNNSKEDPILSGSNEASSSPCTAPATPIYDFDRKETVQIKDIDFEMVTLAIKRVSSFASDDIREERPSLQSDLRSESPATMSFRSALSPIPGGQSDNSHGSTVASRSPRDITDDAAAMAAHRLREQRWISTMATVPASQALKSKKVKKLVLEGVPASVRYLVWAHLTDTKGKRTSGIYQQLSKRVPVSVIRDIERDAAKYFPDHALLRDPKGSIVNLLQAYLTMVPDIEYEKSLVIVAVHILLLAPEEDAFWILVSMMDTYLRPYFSSRTVQMEADATVFGKAVDIVDPKLAKKLFSELRISSIEICRPWFPSIFASALPLEHANRVWDVYLCEGPPFLFRVGIALLSLCRNALETARDGQTVLAILSKPASFSLLPSDPQDLINMAFAVKIRDEEVNKQRAKVEAQLKRQTQTRAPAVASSISLVRP